MENLNQLEIFYKALNEALYALQKHFIEYGEWNKYYDLSEAIPYQNQVNDYYKLAEALSNTKVIHVSPEKKQEFESQKENLQRKLEKCHEILENNPLDLTAEIPNPSNYQIDIPDMPDDYQSPVSTESYQDDIPDMIDDYQSPVSTESYQDDIPDMMDDYQSPVSTENYQDDIPDMIDDYQSPVSTENYQDDIPDMPYDYTSPEALSNYPYDIPDMPLEDEMFKGRHR